MNNYAKEMNAMTSAEANKKLSMLRAELSELIQDERQSCTFVAATVENIEDARPEYSLDATASRISEINAEIRELKHKINQFNVSFVIPGIGMTIDQALIYMPQLRECLSRYREMSVRNEKVRVTGYSKTSPLIEYEYTNYDTCVANELYLTVQDELAKVQLALDKVNSTVDIG